MPHAYSRRLKSISIFLIFILAFEILFSSAEWFAYGDTNATDTKESSETLPNDLSKSEVLEKGTDYTIFKNPDGTRSMDVYQADVRTQDENGELEDIDNSIKKTDEEGKTVYRNQNGFADITLPETITKENPVQLEEKRNKVSFYPVGKEENTTLEMDKTIQEKTENLYYKTQEETTGIRYVGGDATVQYEYFPTDFGLKENIVLKKKPEVNQFRFILQCRGRYLEKEHRAILIRDNETKKVKGVLSEPFMTDALDSENQGFSEDAEYDYTVIDSNKGVYEVILTVSEDYLKDDNRVYPVTIDPTITLNDSATIKDVYVLSKHANSNYYSSGIIKMCIGYGPKDGVCRTYVKFPNLQSKISKAYISSATLKLNERNNTKPYPTVGVYRVTGSWDLGKIKYSSQPSYNGTAVATAKLTGGTASHTLNVTSLVQGWAKGSYKNYGMLLRATSESSSSATFCEFYGGRYGTASKRPKLTVNYTVPSPAVPSKPTVSVDRNAIPKGTKNITVKWSGLESNVFANAQVKLVKYSQQNNTYALANANGKVFAYKDISGSGKSGSYSLDTSGLAEGKYAVVIRGKDKVGNTGDGTLSLFYVDSMSPDAPILGKLQSSRMEATSENAKVEVAVQKGKDYPTYYPSGIAKTEVTLYNADNNEKIGETISLSPSDSTATFENVESGIDVYAKATNEDLAGNRSVEGKSETFTVKPLNLPEFVGKEDFNSSLKKNPWISKGNHHTDTSWNVTYDGNLRKITAEITKKDGTAIAGYEENNILSDEEYPKVVKHYSIEKDFDIESLEDGEYEVHWRFYADDEDSGYREQTVSLNMDNRKPEVTVVSPTDDEEVSGMVQVALTIADQPENQGDLSNLEVRLIGKDVDRVLSESKEIINFNSTEYEDGEYTIQVTATDKAGNKSETAQRVIHISNPVKAPKISVDKEIGTSESNLNLEWNYPSGDATVKKIAALQYALISKGETVSDSDYETFAEEETAQKEGTTSIQTTDLPDGEYTICVRSLDAKGNPGKERTLTYTIDNTDPEIELVSPTEKSVVFGMLFVRGIIKDKKLKKYTLAVANGETTDTAAFQVQKTETLNDGATNVGPYLGMLDLSDETAYPPNQTYTLRIQGEDCAGNKETRYITVEKKDAQEVPADFEIDKSGKNELTFSAEKTRFLLKKEGETYVPENPIWYVDGKQVDGSNGIDCSNPESYPEGSKHSLVVYDNRTDGVLYGVTTLKYELLSSAEKEITSSITDTPELLALSLDVEKDSENHYYLSYNGAKEQEIIPGREILLDTLRNSEEASIGKIELFARDSDGNRKSLEESGSWQLIGRFSQGDECIVDMMGDYTPKNVTAIPSLNSKVKITWETDKDAENVSYEIERSTSPDFDENETECVQSQVKEHYWCDNYAVVDAGNNMNDHEGTRARMRKIRDADLYYRVRAVHNQGKHVRKSGFDEDWVKLPAMNEYAKRLGKKDYLGYSSVDIGMGDGYVEQSTGNLVYQETDANVKGKVLDLSMERTYNSMATGMTALGYGWDFSFSPTLLSTYDRYGDETGMLFKDGSGTIYTFRSIENATDSENGITHYQSPIGVYIHLKKIEKDGETTYEIETLEGDTYVFNGSSQLKEFRDSNGNKVFYEYDSVGKLKSVENPNTGSSGKETEATGKSRIIFHYKDSQAELESELIQSVELPGGQTVKYEYNEDKVLVNSILYNKDSKDSEKIETKYQYTFGDTLLTGIQDANGNKSSIEYDMDSVNPGRCRMVTYPNGDREKFAYMKSEEENDVLLYDSMEQTSYRAGLLNVPKEIGSSEYRFNADGNVIWSRDIEGGEVESKYSLGLEIETTGTSCTYRIDESGVIQNGTAETTSEIQYDRIPDGNTIASKVSSTKGNVTQETDEEGNVTKYEYGDKSAANAGNPTRIQTIAKDGTNSEERFTYDDNGNILRAEDETTGESISFQYDADGQLREEQEYLKDGTKGEKTTYAYDAVGEELQEKESSEGDTSSSYDTINDEYGKVRFERNGENYVTEHRYDVLNRETMTLYYLEKCDVVISEKKSAPERLHAFENWCKEKSSVSESQEYDANGNLTKETDREGRVTTYQYDCMDRVTKKEVRKDAEHMSWKYVYTVEDIDRYFESGNEPIKNALVTTEVNEEGVVTSISCQDKAGNIVKTFNKGIVTSFRYNRDGNITEVYSLGKDEEQNAGIGTGITVLANYDKYGENTANIIAPGYDEEKKAYFVREDTSVLKYEYDSLGNIRKEIDPSGHKTEYRYDVNGRTTKTINTSDTSEASDISITRASYDIPGEDGNTITKITNALNQVSEEEKDASGNTVRITDKGKNTGKKIEIRYTYDANGNMLTEEKAKGIISYEYDSMGNVTRKITRKQDGKARDYSEYTYDYLGMQTERKDYTNGELQRVAQYRYDGMKRLVQSYEGKEKANETDAAWIHYSYDIEGNLVNIRYPESTGIENVEYEYGVYDRLLKVSYTADGEKRTAREYRYRADNRVQSVKDYTSANHSVIKTYGYNRRGQSTDIEIRDSKTGLQEKYKYTYDVCGNITSEKILRGIEKKTIAEEDLTDKGSYHILRKYSYNDLDELRNLKEYRIEGENSDGTGTLTHETSYTYDALGNRKSETKDGTKYVYGYDDLNELLWVEKEGESEKQKKYTYDEDGNQVSEINAEAGTETTYAYDLEGNMLKSVSRARKNGETVETVTENQYNGDGTRVSRTVNGETTYFLYANGNLIGSYTMDSSNQEIVSKHTANVFGINGDIILTIRTGTKSYVYNADIRGSIMSITDDNGDVVQSCYYSVFGEPSVEGTFYNEILYTGAVYDSSTGMYYLSTRFYDSESGRFTSRDSVRGSVDNPLSLNIYAYCVNNPLKYTDEEGEMPTVVAGAIIGGSMGAIFEIADQWYSKGAKIINWKSVAARAAGGAITGAYGSISNIVLLKSITMDAFVGTLENMVVTMTESGKMSNHDVVESAEYAAIDSVGGAAVMKSAGAAVKLTSKMTKGKWSKLVGSKRKNHGGVVVKKKTSQKQIGKRIRAIKKSVKSKVKSAKKAIKRLAKVTFTKARKAYHAVKRRVKRMVRTCRVLKAYASKKISTTIDRFHRKYIKKQKSMRVNGFRRKLHWIF